MAAIRYTLKMRSVMDGNGEVDVIRRRRVQLSDRDIEPSVGEPMVIVDCKGSGWMAQSFG